MSISLPQLPGLANQNPSVYEAFQTLSRLGMSKADVDAAIAKFAAGVIGADGSVSLTANWNAGGFSITSLNSEDCLQAAEYGVVANGSLTVSGTGTDQTAAFVSALTAAVTAGKKLKLPSGVIKFTQNVVIPDIFGVTTDVHVNIEGCGNPAGNGPIGATAAQAGGTILKFWTGAGIHGLSLTPTNSLPFFTLKNLEIQGPDSDATTTSGDGIHLVGAYIRVNFNNVDVNHFGGGKGYNLNAPENGSLINCTASFCDVGFSFNNAANAHALVNVGAQYCHSRGVEILDTVTISVYGGLIQNNYKTGLYMGGVAAQGAGQVYASGIHFENNNTTSTAGMYAAHVLATNAGGSCSCVTFENCRFAAANDKVWLDTTGAATITNVSFIGCRQQPGVLITINTASCYNTLLCQSGAPLTDNGTGTSIISDTLTGNYTFGGSLTAKGNVSITGNLIAKQGGNVTVANGANNNLALPAAGTMFPIVGPTAVANITGIAGGVEGRLIALTNTTAFNVTLNHNNIGSSVGNRFLLPAAADVVLTSYSGVTLLYTGNVWYCIGRNN